MSITHFETASAPITPRRRRELLAAHQELVRHAVLPDAVIQLFSEKPVAVLDRRHRAWIVVPAERDPLRGNDGRHTIPAPQLKELKRLAGFTVRFDRIVIAHELDPYGRACELLPLLAEGPRICPDSVATMLVGPLPPHPGLNRAARILDTIVKGGSSAAAGLGSLVAGAARDPIVFGVIGHPSPVQHGQPALWYPLTAWEW